MVLQAGLKNDAPLATTRHPRLSITFSDYHIDVNQTNCPLLVPSGNAGQDTSEGAIRMARSTKGEIMRVVVAFYDLQPSQASDLGDAFWLADTPTNRARADEAWTTKSTHPNSAIFQEISDVVEDEDILERLDDIDLHQPKWNEVEFFALPLTPRLQARLGDRGAVADRCADGFKVKR